MPRNERLGRYVDAPAFRYCVAIAAACAALLLRRWLSPLFGHHFPYETAWVALLFSVWYCGVGPSIAATLFILFGTWYWILPSAGSVRGLTGTQLTGMLGFAFFSAVLISFGEAIRRSYRRQEKIDDALRNTESQLRRALDNLQHKMRQRNVEVEEKTARMVEQAKLLDLANDAIFVRTTDDRITYWNEGAERLYGWSRAEALARSTHELLGTRFPESLSEISKSERWEGELQQSRRDGSQIMVASRWTRLRDGEGNFAGWLEINTDVTARKRAEEAARRLSGRILSLQDDERRRIARELHDSLGQYLVSLKVNLDLLARMLDGEKQETLLSQCVATADQCLTETRTISHLLHPPLLDEAGLGSAARWYIEGFAERSAFEVEVDLPSELQRLNREVETALFRVLQEALTNVHRHSGGSRVSIQMRVDAEEARLEIRDNGRGIPPPRLRNFREDPSSAGVGLAGMRERVHEVGGLLEVSSSSRGTAIMVTVPLAQDQDCAAEEGWTPESNQDVSAA